MPIRARLFGLLVLAVFAPDLGRSQPPGRDPTPAQAAPVAARFKCQDGSELTARFASLDAQFVAIVDSGDGPHTLPVRPWTGGPVVLTWSDGKHTLTWSPGVQIMWMDGPAHRMCGRGGHKH